MQTSKGCSLLNWAFAQLLMFRCWDWSHLHKHQCAPSMCLRRLLNTHPAALQSESVPILSPDPQDVWCWASMDACISSIQIAKRLCLLAVGSETPALDMLAVVAAACSRPQTAATVGSACEPPMMSPATCMPLNGRRMVLDTSWAMMASSSDSLLEQCFSASAGCKLPQVVRATPTSA